jgi:hypothetical protein
MYRENVAPAPATPIDATRQAVKSCGQLQIGVGIMTAITFTLLTFQFFFYKPPAAFDISAESIHQWRAVGIAGAITYVLVLGTWGVLNAWGLGKRSKVARWSSIFFAAACMVSCFAWPFGGFLLYMLLRRDVKAYFD